MRASIEKPCEHCGVVFAAPARNVNRGWGRFCSWKCRGLWQRAQPRKARRVTIRQLRPDEPVPPGEPRRYRSSHGYIRLRWRVAADEYVELYEHRYVAGRQAPHVHHVNGNKTDNRPENLMAVTPAQHREAHTEWSIDEACALYRSGLSLVQLAERYQRNTSNIMRALKKRGVQMRTISESWTCGQRRHAKHHNGERVPTNLAAPSRKGADHRKVKA